jgi:hypothetical protein
LLAKLLNLWYYKKGVKGKKRQNNYRRFIGNMDIMKKRISVILAVIMIGIAIIPVLSMVKAVSEVSMTVKLGTQTMTQDSTYYVSGGEKINVTASSPAGIAFIGYFYRENNVDTQIYDTNASSIQVTVPTGEPGSTKSIFIEAVAKNDDGTPNTITKTGWIRYYLRYEDEPVENKDLTVSANGSNLSNWSKTTVEVGDSIVLKATPTNEVVELIYAWDDGQNYEVSNYTKTLTVPNYEKGSTHRLYVIARYTDGLMNDWEVYDFVIDEDVVTEKELTVSTSSKTLSVRSTTEVEVEDKLYVKATPSNEVVELIYAWDDGQNYEVSSSTKTLTVPDFEDGSEHTLYVIARYNDGLMDDWQKYYFEIVNDNDDEDEDDDDELIIEPWMRENSDLDELSVSLRNDSDTKKGNKNFYEIDEEVIYYVDYKNGGDDIDSTISIVLDLPLSFRVVDSDGGKVSTSDKTITWTFDGLDEDESGTKEVIIEYTSLGKSSLTYKIVNPIADIKKGSKIEDSSAVINYIFKETDEDIDDTHYPFMYGDKDKPTFRPDDTITRAEAALVLTRIFGISTDYASYQSNYSDLNETYPEARNAIVAATAYGLLNGYPDGSYKPNEPMTRACFMAVIARRIEIENDDVRGLEIKDEDTSLKVYKDSTRQYIVNGQSVGQHWALNEVTLLARLNMTAVSKSNTSLRLDDRITRAEVAQLMNFYLLRAPAKTSYSNIGLFMDVSSAHPLYSDIVEATQGAHDFSITSDGREKLED